MNATRRDFLATLGTAATCLVTARIGAADRPSDTKRHLVTLSFDDGFRKSFVRTAEAYEKHGLSACFNVVAAGLPDDKYIKGVPLGDFTLWNELKRRGHEIMPHG